MANRIYQSEKLFLIQRFVTWPHSFITIPQLIDFGSCKNGLELEIGFSVGLSYDTINKKLGSSGKLEGLHNGPPGFTFIIFPSVFETFSFTNLRVS